MRVWDSIRVPAANHLALSGYRCKGQHHDSPTIVSAACGHERRASLGGRTRTEHIYNAEVEGNFEVQRLGILTIGSTSTSEQRHRQQQLQATETAPSPTATGMPNNELIYVQQQYPIHVYACMPWNQNSKGFVVDITVLLHMRCFGM